jgi:hypothetical protein
MKLTPFSLVFFSVAISLLGADSGQPFNSPESLLALIPSTVHVKEAGKWNAMGMAEASKILSEKAASQPATFRLKVTSLNFSGGPSGRISVFSSGHVLLKGFQIPCDTYAYFDPAEADGLKSVHPGETILVNGTIRSTHFNVSSDVWFYIYLEGCKVQRGSPGSQKPSGDNTPSPFKQSSPRPAPTF